jgi:hypothetical protein
MNRKKAPNCRWVERIRSREAQYTLLHLPSAARPVLCRLPDKPTRETHVRRCRLRDRRPAWVVSQRPVDPVPVDQHELEHRWEEVGLQQGLLHA